MSIRVLFYGTPDFSVPTLQALINDEQCAVVAVVTQPDRRSGRGQKVHPSPIKKLAIDHGLPVLQPESIKKNCDSFLNDLKQFGRIDIAIVVAFGQILPKRVLAVPTVGSINIHASLLPRWRGAAPLQRAILAGDTETGVCIMQMEAGLDTGPVFATAKTPILNDTTCQHLHDSLAALGASTLLAVLPAIVDGTLESVPQSDDGITYAEKIQPDTCCIDWEQSAEDIERLVRAVSPYPGAFTFFDTKRLKIYDAKVKKLASSIGKAGEIVTVEKALIEVQCGKDVLSLHAVQLEGKRRMSVAEFLQGTRLREGVVLASEKK